MQSCTWPARTSPAAGQRSSSRKSWRAALRERGRWRRPRRKVFCGRVSRACLCRPQASATTAIAAMKCLTEDNAPGAGFLAEVCKQWEAATAPARDAGVRVVNLRIGVVLARDGGALKPMLLPFRLGLGGRVGSGRQWWSWVSLDDVIGAMLFALQDELAGSSERRGPGAGAQRGVRQGVGQGAASSHDFPSAGICNSRRDE